MAINTECTFSVAIKNERLRGEWVEDRVAWAGVLPQERRDQLFGVAQVLVLEFGGKLAALLFLQA
jgi:hypothetical protein